MCLEATCAWQSAIVTKFAVDFFGGTVVAGDITLPNLVNTLAIGLACIDTLTY